MPRKSLKDIAQIPHLITASLLGGLIGGSAVLILGMALLKAGAIQAGKSPSYAIVDTQQILKEQAQALMGASKSLSDAEGQIEPLIAEMDAVMSQLSQEEGIILLQPKAVAGFHVLDLTAEVRRRLSALRERGKP